MNPHLISGSALEQIKTELVEGKHWMVYNTTSYFLDKYDVYFFLNKEQADEFAKSNISEYDDFRVTKVSTVEDALKQISNHEHYLEYIQKGCPQTQI